MTTRNDPVLSVRIPTMMLERIDHDRGERSRTRWFIEMVEERFGPTPEDPSEKNRGESPLPPLKRPIVPPRRSSKKESFIASHVDDVE